MAMAKEHGCSVKDIYGRPDNGPLFFCCFPGSLCGGLEWSCQSAAPRLRHLRMVSVGQNTRGLERTGDL